jgi:hypothetical protein
MEVTRMAKKTTTNDRVRLGPQIGPNARLAVRERDGEISTAIVQKARDGDSIPEGGELAQVDNPDCTCGRWQDVTTLYERGEGCATESGPAQVATEAYRAGHDRIFGKKPTVGLA